MEGFFTKKQGESKARPDGKSYSCVSCGLSKGCKSPKMKASGGFKKGILNIASYPTKIEDRKGEAFKSKSFKYLEKAYKKVGIDLYKDCLNMYAVNCMTSETPTPYQIDCCRKFIIKTIEKHKPKVIVLFGQSALYSVIGNRWKKDLGTIFKWQGWKIPDQELKAWVYPTFPPSFIENAKSNVEAVLWNKDLEQIAELTKMPFREFKEPNIEYLQENELHKLDKIQVGNIVFDYEATGLKLHAKGHKIICVSVVTSNNHAYSFMLPKNKVKRKPFLDLLQRKSVGKIAQNLKYEDNATNVRLRIPVKNWVYDTMLAAHIMDNRKGVTGLKFQAYVQFGIVDYDSEVSPYLRPIKDIKNANAINQIETLLEKPEGKALLLKYCAYDSILTYRLASLFKKQMRGTQGQTDISPLHSDFPNAYSLFHEGIQAFARSERHGIRIDVPHLIQQKEKLTKRIELIEKKIYKSTFFKDWHKHSKSKPKLNSGKQLADYLYGVKKLKPYKETKGGAGSTDEDSLKMLGIPEMDMLIQRSKYLKLRDTYLDGIHREQVKGILHPFFNLHLVTTYRSSSNSINFQNLPKRDPFGMRTVRSCIFPSKGNQLLDMDFKGVEVAIGVAYHQDPTMIKYVSDPSTDMHGDMAEQIFKLDKLDKSLKSHKILRGSAKNGFVFPQFYGDYYRNNAESICRDWVQLPAKRWKAINGILLADNITLGEHLIQHGIKSYSAFEKHLQEIETDFWTNRFPVYDKWRNKQWEEYQKNGYIPFKTGFICKGLMNKKNVGNASIQGTAFHCTLWTYIEVEKELIKRKLKTKILGQIHDDIVFDVYPPELLEVYDLVQEIGTVRLPKAWDWINVPLSIDAELCPVDGSWAEKEDWKPLDIQNDDLPF